MSLFDIFKSKKENARYAEKLREKKTHTKDSSTQGEAVKTSRKKEKKDTGALTVQFKESKIAEKIIHSPHVTEKSTYLSEGLQRGKSQGGHYIFKVSERSNKPLIKKAVEESYGVKVERVRILPARKKTLFMRGTKGVKSGFKKALVILRKGDKIEFV